MNPAPAPDTPQPAESPDVAPARPTPSVAEGVVHAGSSRWLLPLLAGVSGIALVTVLLLWQKVSGMQEALARQSAQTQVQALEANAMAKQAVSLAQESAARAAVLDARLTEVALQRSQLDELMQSMSRSRDENLVVDIEAAIRLAQQQAQLTGSVEPLLAALKSAEQRIIRAAQPRLTLLQRAVARDIDRVKAAAVSDTPMLLIKLDELVRLADELQPANAPMLAGQHDENVAMPPKAAVSWWQTGLEVFLGEAKNLVRVSQIQSPEAALLSPGQAFFLKENFKLKLLNARLGLLARQIESARADLTDAERMLKKYFQANARPTQASAALLQQVQVQMRALQIPRVDETLAVLATAAAGR